MADSEKVPEQQQQQAAAQPAKNEAATNDENAAENAAEEQEPQPPKQVIGEWKKNWPQKVSQKKKKKIEASQVCLRAIRRKNYKFGKICGSVQQQSE